MDFLFETITIYIQLDEKAILQTAGSNVYHQGKFWQNILLNDSPMQMEY